LTDGGALRDKGHTVPVIDGNDGFITQSDIAGRPIGVSDQPWPLVSFSLLGGLGSEIIDPLCRLGSGVEIEDRAVRLGV